jgi:hypothetical protein
MIKTHISNRSIAIYIIIAIMISSFFAVIINNNQVRSVNNIIFPVLGGGRYSNDFYAPRFNGTHYATDVIVPKHTPLVSPVDGVVYYLMYPQASWGYSLGIRDDDGFEYNFLHLNDDNDGTKDSSGGPMKAYAPDMKVGNRVVRGQHIGWVGDSGYANGIPHLHFEIYDQNKQPINPYEYLRNATIIYQPTAIYPKQAGESLPYGANIKTATQLAAGNLDGDSGKEYITGTGIGSSPHVRVFNDDYSFDDYGFFAYASNYFGGVNVAAGDVDGDGVDEIITGTGPGSTTHVRVFKKDGQPLGGFFCIPGLLYWR